MLVITLCIKLVTAYLFVVSHVSAWNMVNHDAVASIPEHWKNAIVARFKPFFLVEDASSACVPFPAVDAFGLIGSGLDPSGPQSSMCRQSRGQVYARTMPYQGRIAIMYAYYFPKDQRAIPAFLWDKHKQRHEWLSAIVWVDDPMQQTVSYTAQFQGASYVPTEKWSGTGSRIWLGRQYYESIEVDVQHQGADMPLIEWDVMPAAAREVFMGFQWGTRESQIVPFIPGEFEARVKATWKPKPHCNVPFDLCPPNIGYNEEDDVVVTG